MDRRSFIQVSGALALLPTFPALARIVPAKPTVPYDIICRVAVSHFGPSVIVTEPKWDSRQHNILVSYICVPDTPFADTHYTYNALAVDFRELQMNPGKEHLLWEARAEEACYVVAERLRHEPPHPWQDWARRRTHTISYA